MLNISPAAVKDWQGTYLTGRLSEPRRHASSCISSTRARALFHFDFFCVCMSCVCAFLIHSAASVFVESQREQGGKADTPKGTKRTERGRTTKTAVGASPVLHLRFQLHTQRTGSLHRARRGGVAEYLRGHVPSAALRSAKTRKRQREREKRNRERKRAPRRTANSNETRQGKTKT